MEPKRSLSETVEFILRDFPELSMQDDAASDGICIRRSGSEGDDGSDNVVGNYTEEAFDKGDITETDIREDCEEFVKS